MPESALAWLDPVRVGSAGLASGVSYHFLRAGRGPWVVHLVGVDLERCDIALEVLPAGDPPPGTDARERVSALAAGADGVIAAVNGDFFTPEGRPLGWEVVEGVALSRARGATFAWSRERGPWFGLAVEATTDPSTAAVGGYPVVVRAGLVADDLTGADRPTSTEERHPRTAVGFDADGGALWLVVVDGRREGYSEGMSLLELADLLLALGVDEALNLDGGGSSTMVLGATPVNRPSAPEGERSVANALAVVRRPEGCAPPASDRH